MNTMTSAPTTVRTGLPVEIRQPAPDTLPSPGGEGQGEGGIAVPDSQPAGGTAVLDFLSSDETLDRYDEIISASGWKLDSYLRNPVFQNAHQYGDILFTLGKALTTEVRTISSRAALFQRIEFAVDANPIARLAFKLYQGGFLKAVSVGFIPIRWQDGTAESTFRRKYFEQELLEVSAVSIPANPNALALAFRSGAVEKSDLRDVADLCAHTLSASPSPSPLRAEGRGEVSPSSALHPLSALTPDLLSLSKTISSLLKH